MTKKSNKQKWSELAWMGWQLSMPSDWRPLRIEGEWQKGKMVVGDGEQLSMQIQWLRSGNKRFNPDRVIEQRAHKEKKKNSLSESTSCPSAEGFGNMSWLKGEADNERAVWSGYSANNDLLIEIIARLIDGKTIKWFEKRIIPSLRAFSADEAMPISVFGSSFMSPPGFQIKTWKLKLGDITIQLEAKGGKSLLLRQVYPAGLALSRRPMEQWQKLKPFKEHRKFKADGEPAQCEIEKQGRTLKGIRSRGFKRLPAPLGMIAARKSMSVVVHDAAADRIFVAEYDAKRDAREKITDDAIASMNWAMQGEDS